MAQLIKLLFSSKFQLHPVSTCCTSLPKSLKNKQISFVLQAIVIKQMSFIAKWLAININSLSPKINFVSHRTLKSTLNQIIFKQTFLQRQSIRDDEIQIKTNLT